MLQRLAYRVHGNVVPALAAHCQIMLLALPVEVDAKRQILTRLEEVEFLLKQQSIGAQIDISLARDQAFHNLADLRVHERLASRDRHHRCPAFVHGAEALLRGELLLKDVSRVLDFAAAGARQIAAKQGLEHEHERILLAAGELLPQDIARHGPHL